MENTMQCFEYDDEIRLVTFNLQLCSFVVFATCGLVAHFVGKTAKQVALSFRAHTRRCEICSKNTVTLDAVLPFLQLQLPDGTLSAPRKTGAVVARSFFDVEPFRSLISRSVITEKIDMMFCLNCCCYINKDKRGGAAAEQCCAHRKPVVLAAFKPGYGEPIPYCITESALREFREQQAEHRRQSQVTGSSTTSAPLLLPSSTPQLGQPPPPPSHPPPPLLVALIQ
jgi:hypothetical protein